MYFCPTGNETDSPESGEAYDPDEADGGSSDWDTDQ